MKVWFGTTTAKWPEYKQYYFLINNYLKELGCVLPFDWLDRADSFYKTSYKERNITKIYNEVIKAIDESNAVVIEYSVPNFSSSHQINYALLSKKPTLVIRLTKDNPRFSDSYLEAVQSPYLTLSNYSLNNYKEVLEEFIGMSKLDQGYKRYNIVLDTKQKHYLDWLSNHSKISRSEVIRKLIDQKIDLDEKYRLYKSYK